MDPVPERDKVPDAMVEVPEKRFVPEKIKMLGPMTCKLPVPLMTP